MPLFSLQLEKDVGDQHTHYKPKTGTSTDKADWVCLSEGEKHSLDLMHHTRIAGSCWGQFSQC